MKSYWMRFFLAIENTLLSAEAKSRRSQRNRIRYKKLEHNLHMYFEGHQINMNTQ